MDPVSSHDDRTSLRPVVLGLCFAWGVLCGFLLHALRKPPEVRVEREPVKKVEAPAGGEEIPAPVETVAVKPGAEAAVPRRDDPSKTYNDIRATAREEKTPAMLFAASLPPLASPALSVNLGLTGTTTRPPSGAGELLVRPSPTVPARKETSFGPPELD